MFKRPVLVALSCFATVALVGCPESDTPTSDASADVDAATETGQPDATKDGHDAGDDSGAEAEVGGACADVDCSGHGTCVDTAGAASCTCDADYAVQDLTCINTRMVPCTDAAPENGVATPGDVEVTYTDADGWSAPAECAWTCDAGFSPSGDWCLADTFIDEQCATACLQTGACEGDITFDFDVCKTDCILSASSADALAEAACIGLNYEHDALWCGSVPGCDVLSAGDTCAADCAAKAACGFLDTPGINSGTSLAECNVMCRAHESVFTGLETNEAYAACVASATASCDPYEMGLCESYNGASLCGNVCSWLSTPDFCDYIPGQWDDAEACEATCSAWTPEQQHFVFGCYNKLSFNDCTTDKAVSCFDVPTELPAGFTDLVAAVAEVCPYAMASADPGVNAWHFLGRSGLWADFMTDYSKAAACIAAKGYETCPNTYSFDWMAPCFLDIDTDVVDACNNVQGCFQSMDMIDQLTIDGTTTMSQDQCQPLWQLWKADDATAFGDMASCLDSIDTNDCGAVDACIAGVQPVDPKATACTELTACWDTAGTNPYGYSSMDNETCIQLAFFPPFGNDPELPACITDGADCDAKAACLPISGLAPNAVPVCSELVPCMQAAQVNPFEPLGDLTVESCAAGVSISTSDNPGIVDTVYGCIQGASDCNAILGCVPQPPQ